MSLTFHKVTLTEFSFLLTRFPFTRRVSTVHLHHTKRPNQRQYRGRDSIVELWRQHTQGYGFCTIAAHVIVAPDGAIWLGRHWNVPPASAAGHNGNQTDGPFMIALVGDFDYGEDRLVEPQREVALQLIGQIQHHFGLPVETLRFGCELTQMTSPGQSIDRSEFLRDLRKRCADQCKGTEENMRVRPFGEDALEMNLVLDAFNRTLPNRMDPPDAQLSEPITDNQDYYRYTRDASTLLSNNETGRSASNALTDEMIAELRPNVINLTQGRFSTTGSMQTEQSDVDTIFDERLIRALDDAKARNEKLRLLFYAHGGLVSESNALQQAYRHVAFWKKNNIYPIYFVWETGLFETIGQLFTRAQQQAGERGVREFLTDGVIETLVRSLGGPMIWQGMKESAHLAATTTGGAYYTAQKLQKFCAAHPNMVELHAIGHSAGSIFHSYFLPLIFEQSKLRFQTVHFLAPAITVPDFQTRLEKWIGMDKPINKLTLFALRKDLELNDAAFGYGKSILYLISLALEAARNIPILGMEVSLRSDNTLKNLFGLRGQASNLGEVIWANTCETTTGRSASQARKHGEFGSDAPTMNSLLRRVLNLDDNDPIQGFLASANRSIDHWENQFDWPRELEYLLRPTLPSLPTRLPSPIKGFTPQPFLSPNRAQFNGNGGGHRRALCVGIDHYPRQPLAGCVADAQQWAQTLTAVGFEPPTLLLDEAATRAGILTALTNLVTNSAPGDVVVFQYAGHGTLLPDLNGDEVAEEVPNKDEAICPYDFTNGAFLIDDDIGEIFARTPSGVNVTCFIDCCHSGTISRFAVGAPEQSQTSARDERPRFLVADAELIEAHRRFRRSIGRNRSLQPRGPANMQEVLFSACQSSEVAWESDGHGDFTVQATRILGAGIAGLSNQAFIKKVSEALGPAPRQHPNLDCAPAGNSLGLLQPLETMPVEPANLATMNGTNGQEMTAAQLLQKLSIMLRTAV